MLPVTVPGTVDGWATLLDAYGTIFLADALAPAIWYAEEGFPVAELTSHARIRNMLVRLWLASSIGSGRRF